MPPLALGDDALDLGQRYELHRRRAHDPQLKRRLDAGAGQAWDDKVRRLGLERKDRDGLLHAVEAVFPADLRGVPDGRAPPEPSLCGRLWPQQHEADALLRGEGRLEHREPDVEPQGGDDDLRPLPAADHVLRVGAERRRCDGPACQVADPLPPEHKRQGRGELLHLEGATAESAQDKRAFLSRLPDSVGGGGG